MIFIHQDLWYGKLVPSSHQRGKPSHTILCSFSRGNDRIWKGIPISDCLREEWALVNVSSCSGGLKSQWVMISTVPNWGITSSVGMQAAPFRPLYKRISLLSLLLFLRDSQALGHHTMQPNEMPDKQCTMLVKKPTRRSMRILTPSLFVCVEVLRPSQPNRVMSSAVSLPNHTFTGQA